ncbi:uncharacterized protein N7525_004649, partial [Penicillium rubens]|uniref:uncharacterized protein n=1 Tax=Penicillium rubens TaxID=1108849 RepID=UPI002A59B7DD
PPTVWCDGTPDWATLKKPTYLSAPSSRPQPDLAVTTSAPAHPELAQLKDQDQAWNLQPVFQNPWLTYEAIVFLSVKPLLETRSQFSYPSFLGLLGCYCWEDQVFLVWELVELLVSQILVSRCTITEGEVAAIVRPVLEGIQYLRGRGRALAALSADTMLLTESGGVRIAGGPHEHSLLTVVHVVAGVEHSCQIDTAEMDAATLKLFALAEVVKRLIMKNPLHYLWSAEAKGLPEELKSCCSPEELLRSKLFEQLGDEGELKMLVNAANKTAYHNLESFKRI